MPDRSELSPLEQSIVDLLREGRETTGSIEDQLGKDKSQVAKACRELRESGWIEYYHEPTALHSLARE